MLIFAPINLNSITSIKKHLKYCDYNECDYSITTLFIWENYKHFNYTYAIQDNVLYIKSDVNGQISFFMPICKNSNLLLGFHTLNEYCKIKQIKLSFCCVPEKGLERIKKHFKKLEIIQYLDWFDYLYSKDDLKYLKGKKYANKRNHINHFNDTYKYEYISITIETIPLAISFINEFKKKYTNDEMLLIEAKKLVTIFNNFDLFKLKGGMLKVDNKIIALTLGDILNNNTLCIHTEKAFKEYHGSYAVINQMFIQKNDFEELKYINREEDMGLSNLRYSKQNYHPIKLLYKYIVNILE